MRGDYTVSLNLTGNGLDDPDQTLYENFTCGAEGNYDRYCSPELDKMVDRQSIEFDPAKRKELVWAIERKLAEDAARPILWRNLSGTCWHPYVKGGVPCPATALTYLPEELKRREILSRQSRSM
jgi:peptide/nickel transport system substrate-binding protein